MEVDYLGFPNELNLFRSRFLTNFTSLYKYLLRDIKLNSIKYNKMSSFEKENYVLNHVLMAIRSAHDYCTVENLVACFISDMREYGAMSQRELYYGKWADNTALRFLINILDAPTTSQTKLLVMKYQLRELSGTKKNELSYIEEYFKLGFRKSDETTKLITNIENIKLNSILRLEYIDEENTWREMPKLPEWKHIKRIGSLVQYI